jgi:translocation and assembly module TamB
MQTTNWDAPVQLQAKLSGLHLPHVQLDQAQWSVTGTARDHRSSLSVQGRPAKANATPMTVSASVKGSLQPKGRQVAGWQGRIQDLSWRTDSQPQHVWLKANPFDLVWRHDEARDQVGVSPVGLNVAGVPMTLQEFDWQAGEQGLVQLKTWLKVDPLLVPVWLKQWQPQVGWGGDLTVGGEVRLSHSAAQPWQVQAHVAKLSGDLSLSEPGIEGNSVQKLGIDVASIKLAASHGVWVLSEVFEGSVLGRLSGRQSVTVSNPQQPPSGADLLSGVDARQPVRPQVDVSVARV